MKRLFWVPIVLCLTAVLVVGTIGSSSALPATPPGLVLWNKLGSVDEVLHSEAGANGVIVGASYAFEPAQHGNGYVRKSIGANYVKFPASVLDNLRERGAIELWVNPKAPNPVPYAYGLYGLVGAPLGRWFGVWPDGCNVCLYWGDGVSGRGFYGEMGFDSQYASTPPEATQFVATPGVPVHAAIVWDITGIAGAADTIRMYRDGQIVGQTSATWNPAGTDTRDILTGYGPDYGGYDKFIVDNIKIWDYAKTDFSDRFEEGFNQPPACGAATANPALLWPPDNKFVSMNIGGVTDADGDPLTLTITSIFQDEPVGKGNSAPDGKGVGASTAELRAEKLGSGDGRVYHIYFTASDGHGGTCTGEVRVSVPHDQAKDAVDSDPLYDSTAPTP